MRKLTKADVETLRKEMPVLDENSQRRITGGCGSYSNDGWSCVFDSFIHYYGGGVTRDNLLSAYMSRTGRDPRQEGYVDTCEFANMIASGYGIGATISDTPTSGYGSNQYVFVQTTSGVPHMMKLDSAYKENGRTILVCTDSATGKRIEVDFNNCTGFMAFETDGVVTGCGSASDPGDSGYSGR